MLENILLLQMRMRDPVRAVHDDGADGAERRTAGLHKRMMFLATAVPLAASIDRMGWLPTTLPASPMATDCTSCWRWRRCSCGT